MSVEPLPEIRRESRREHIAKLLAWCDERLRTHPADIESLLEISKALWDMGQRAEALGYSQEILTRHPGHPKVREAIQRYAAEFAGGKRSSSNTSRTRA